MTICILKLLFNKKLHRKNSFLLIKPSLRQVTTNCLSTALKLFLNVYVITLLKQCKLPHLFIRINSMKNYYLYITVQFSFWDTNFIKSLIFQSYNFVFLPINFIKIWFCINQKIYIDFYIQSNYIFYTLITNSLGHLHSHCLRIQYLAQGRHCQMIHKIYFYITVL